MLERIRARLSQLSPAEQRVGKAILERPNQIAEAPIARIAIIAGVSQPTVVRFCRSLDCKGLSDFKLRLARSLVSGMPFIHSTVDAGDSTVDLASKVFDNSISALIRARNDLGPESIGRAIDWLASARSIEFWGLGNSGITAQDAQHKFFRFGPPALAYADPHVFGMSAALRSPGDIVVAISGSGRTLDMLEAVESARSAGARVISITPGGSPLAAKSDLVLIAEPQEDPDIYAPMTTRLIHLALLDVLAVGVAMRGGAPLANKLEQAKRTLSKRRMTAPIR